MTEELRKQGGLVDVAAADAADKTVDQAAVAPELDEAAKAAAAREARHQALYEENERAEDERARAEAERMRDVDDEDEDETPRDTWATVRRLWSEAAGDHWRFYIVFASIVFYAIFNTAAPAYSARVIDELWGHIQVAFANDTTFNITWENCGRTIFIYFMIWTAAASFYALQSFLMSSVAERLNLRLRNRIAQKLNRLFTRFDTLDEIDPNMSTGIGLSLVKELLNLLHGTVRVDSKLGEGSSFFIRLPGNRDVFDADANIEFILADSKNSGQEVAIPDKLTEEEEDKETRILIIEDNEELRHFICGVLAREYVVLEAGNGCQGLEMTLRELPDIVISDIMMPEMDGIEYLKRVKGNNDICHIPIILLSAKSSLNDQIQGLEYGADEYITKPFSSAYLKARVDSLLKQRQILYDYYISKMREGEKDTSLMEQLTPSTPQVTHFDNDFIRNILQSVEENIQNSEFKIDDLAEAMSMSRTVFYRKVKSLMGVSPVDFVKTMRIKRAVQLLEQDEFTVSEVGYMSGFTTPQYFSRVFKEAMGCTPKEYRLKHKTIVEQNV